MVEKDTIKSFCTQENIGQEIAADSKEILWKEIKFNEA
jgi:hypothetical protein